MLRKLILGLAAVTLLCLPVQADDMTLDEVLASHYEVIGGLDAWKAVDTFQFTGTFGLGQGMEAPFTMTFERDMKGRLDFTLQGMTATQAYDGETAWAVLPFLGKPLPEEMADDQAKSWKQQADIDGVLVDYDAKGHTLTLAGLEEIEGTEAYKIEVELETGDTQDIYLDAENFVMIKTVSKTEIQGNIQETETTYSEYDYVGDLLFFHSIESKQKGAPDDQAQVITLKEVELGVEVPEDFFSMEKAMEDAKAAMEAAAAAEAEKAEGDGS